MLLKDANFVCVNTSSMYITCREYFVHDISFEQP